jgi:hypothetical protein
MSIQEFHSKMKPGTSGDALFEALRLLKNVDDPAILQPSVSPWDLWPAS